MKFSKKQKHRKQGRRMKHTQRKITKGKRKIAKTHRKIKKNKTKRAMKGGDALGSGSYGCIFRPAITNFDPTKVLFANDEYNDVQPGTLNQPDNKNQPLNKINEYRYKQQTQQKAKELLDSFYRFPDSFVSKMMLKDDSEKSEYFNFRKFSYLLRNVPNYSNYYVINNIFTTNINSYLTEDPNNKGINIVNPKIMELANFSACRSFTKSITSGIIVNARLSLKEQLINVAKFIEKYKDDLYLIHMPYAGIDLEKFISYTVNDFKYNKYNHTFYKINNTTNTTNITNATNITNTTSDLEKTTILHKISLGLKELLVYGIIPMNNENVVHNDLKGSNIVTLHYTEYDKIVSRIIDWGLSFHYSPRKVENWNNNDPNMQFQYLQGDVPSIVKEFLSLEFNLPFSKIVFHENFYWEYDAFLQSINNNKNNFDDNIDKFLYIYLMKYMTVKDKNKPNSIISYNVGHMRHIAELYTLYEFDLDIDEDEQMTDLLDLHNKLWNDKYKGSHREWFKEENVAWIPIIDYLKSVCKMHTIMERNTYVCFNYRNFFENVYMKNADIWGFVIAYVELMRTDYYMSMFDMSHYRNMIECIFNNAATAIPIVFNNAATATATANPNVCVSQLIDDFNQYLLENIQNIKDLEARDNADLGRQSSQNVRSNPLQVNLQHQNVHMQPLKTTDLKPFPEMPPLEQFKLSTLSKPSYKKPPTFDQTSIVNSMPYSLIQKNMEQTTENMNQQNKRPRPNDDNNGDINEDNSMV
jgi:hypothetical protein